MDGALQVEAGSVCLAAYRCRRSFQRPGCRQPAPAEEDPGHFQDRGLDGLWGGGGAVKCGGSKLALVSFPLFKEAKESCFSITSSRASRDWDRTPNTPSFCKDSLSTLIKKVTFPKKNKIPSFPILVMYLKTNSPLYR